MSKISVFILDDEEHCTLTLTKLLEWTFPKLKISGVFNDPREALTALRKSPPDLLFLDIEMPYMNGFDILKAIPNPEFKVIFTTAYDEFAIEAIKVNALAYVLKPIDEDELILAVNKTLNVLTVNKQQDLILSLFNSLKEQNPNLNKAAIPTLEGLEFIELDQIIYCEAEGNYTKIFLLNYKTVVVSKPLKQVQEIISSPQFFRTHNSFLVNLLYVKKYLKGKGGQLVLKNDKIIPVSRLRKEELMNMF
ncbi:MAG: LytTR family DNA-binding domain-containing protein [Bacteroidota bacterium]